MEKDVKKKGSIVNSEKGGMDKKDTGKSITFSFPVQESPLIVTTEDILGIVQAYFAGKEFDGVSKYTRLDAEHAFGFFQACDFIEDANSNEYLLIYVNDYVKDPNHEHNIGCFSHC